MTAPTPPLSDEKQAARRREGALKRQIREAKKRIRLAALPLGQVRVIVSLPPSTNHLYVTVGSHRRKSFAAMEYEREVADECLRQGLPGGRSFKPPLQVTIKLYVKDHRRRDIDNIKVVLDALSKALDFDDSEIEHLAIWKKYDRDWQRCEVMLASLRQTSAETSAPGTPTP